MTMKESDLKTKFDTFAGLHRQSLEDHNSRLYLEALRDAVRGLQESGMNVSLEVRPRREGIVAPSDGARTTIANATTIADGQRLDWVHAHNYQESTLHAYLAGSEVAVFTSEREHKWSGPWQPPATIAAASLKDAVMNVIVNATAEKKVLADYNVPATGITGMLDKKAIATPLLTKPAP